MYSNMKKTENVVLGCVEHYFFVNECCRKENFGWHDIDFLHHSISLTSNVMMQQMGFSHLIIKSCVIFKKKKYTIYF